MNDDIETMSDQTAFETTISYEVRSLVREEIMFTCTLLLQVLAYTRLPVTRWVKLSLNFESQSRV